MGQPQISPSGSPLTVGIQVYWWQGWVLWLDWGQSLSVPSAQRPLGPGNSRVTDSWFSWEYWQNLCELVQIRYTWGKRNQPINIMWPNLRAVGMRMQGRNTVAVLLKQRVCVCVCVCVCACVCALKNPYSRFLSDFHHLYENPFPFLFWWHFQTLTTHFLPFLNVSSNFRFWFKVAK